MIFSRKVVLRLFQFTLRKSCLNRTQRGCSILLNSSINGLSHKNKTFSVSKFVGKTFNQVRAMSALSPLDPSSFSRPELAKIKHISLSLNVDFDKKILSGAATLNVDVLDDVQEVILDARDLNIESIESEDGKQLEYKLGEEVPNYGSKLTISFGKQVAQGDEHTREKVLEPSDPKDIILTFNGYMYEYYTGNDSHKTCDNVTQTDENICTHCKRKKVGGCCRAGIKLKIKYSTVPTASALQWLEPEQTSGKQYPYLFSQCQPIHARSIVPCQDTPAVKFTYDAQVTAPQHFTVLMSALRSEPVGNVTRFNQPMPLPAYLIAIAVGVLEFRSLGPRSKVWSETAEIERSAWEFAETEKYLQAAERLCGAYEWNTYDLLVLPPSFPYGGMENPCLTFVTPTLLAGDRSLADVIVHEIMHSWTGNLVTNRNFEHFWLNEGFTVFLERKVGASLIQDPVEAKKSRDFNSILGLQELTETIVDTLGSDNPLTQLVPNLKGVHPDDSFSRVPYEKGSLFLRYLEDLLQGPEVFDEFLRAYLTKFSKKSLDTDEFKSFLLEYFKGNEALNNIDWQAWLYVSGMPPVIPDYDTSMTKAVTSLVDRIASNPQFSYKDIQVFTPHQMIHFLQTLIDRPPLSLEAVRTLGEEYKVASSKNAEIKYRWVRLCIRSKDQDKVQEAFDFVNSQGRMKYVRPVYRDLYAWEDIRQQTIDNFLANEKYMMHVSAYTLRNDLHLSE